MHQALTLLALGVLFLCFIALGALLCWALSLISIGSLLFETFASGGGF